MKPKEDQHLPETTEKRRPTSPEKDRKHSAYAALLEKGLSKSNAAKALGYSTGSIGMLDAAIERKSLKLTLVSTSNIRIAHRAVKLIAQGKTFGDIETVRASDSLAASKEILDRAEPKLQDSRPETYKFTVVNLDCCKPGHPSYEGDLLPFVPDAKPRTDEDP